MDLIYQSMRWVSRGVIRAELGKCGVLGLCSTMGFSGIWDSSLRLLTIPQESSWKKHLLVMLGLNVASVTSRSSVVDTATLVSLHSLLKASINPYSRPISVGYSLANPFSLWHRPLANLCPYTTLSNNHAVFPHG